jgi:PP-loop superfamily ATP-utilizing enzyme
MIANREEERLNLKNEIEINDINHILKRADFIKKSSDTEILSLMLEYFTLVEVLKVEK